MIIFCDLDNTVFRYDDDFHDNNPLMMKGVREERLDSFGLSRYILLMNLPYGPETCTKCDVIVLRDGLGMLI